MKTKLSLLVSSIATIALVLALALSQSATNSTSAIHELTATEMEGITGTGPCNAPVEKLARYDPPQGWGCNVDTNCVHPNSAPCGTDYTYYYKTYECSGATIDGGWGCKLVDTADPEYTQHDCYCIIWSSTSQPCGAVHSNPVAGASCPKGTL